MSSVPGLASSIACDRMAPRPVKGAWRLWGGPYGTGGKYHHRYRVAAWSAEWLASWSDQGGHSSHRRAAWGAVGDALEPAWRRCDRQAHELAARDRAVDRRDGTVVGRRPWHRLRARLFTPAASGQDDPAASRGRCYARAAQRGPVDSLQPALHAND